MINPDAPLGPPAFDALVFTTAIRADQCIGPLELFEQLGGQDRPGAVLMESASHGGTRGRLSVVIPEPAVRLVLRGTQAVYSAMTAEGSLVLDALGERLAQSQRDGMTLRAVFPTANVDPSLTDDERICAPCALSALRDLACLVRDASGGASLHPGVFGAVSYEIVDLFETLPDRRVDPFDEPDITMVLALDSIVYDHIRGEAQIITRALTEQGRAQALARHERYLNAMRSSISSHALVHELRADEQAIVPDISDETYMAGVKTFLEHIVAGDIFQGVLSRGLWMRSAASPTAVYRALRARNPSPYMFYVTLDDGVLLGASPETFLKVQGRELEIRPIAGTAPRGMGPHGAPDRELDTRLAISLLLDQKEQAEHAMLVDLARNDVARVAVQGTRRVLDPLSIEKYSHVQHLVSRVVGELRPELDALHAYRSAANMGTLTGAPKLRAMEIIREVEPYSRGFFGGAVGYLLQDGSFDSCIVIRSLRYRAGDYFTRAGAGIVADSVPRRELEETAHKARACRMAVALAEKALS